MNQISARKLLVVDDDPEMRLGLKYILEKDYKVVAVDSGEEAVHIARKEAFPVAILDLLMGGMSGIETLHHLKEINEFQKVLILTGYSSKDTAISAVNMGAFKYLLKPIGTAAMKGVIDEAFVQFEREIRTFNKIYAPEQLEAFGLTQRETEVALRINHGELNADIAKELELSQRTVEKHVQAIFSKLKIKSRSKLASRIRE